MYCPECGTDAGDANFCPECGADLREVRGAIGHSTAPASGPQGRKGDAKDTSTSRTPTTPSPAASPASQGGGRLSPRVIWAAFAAVAVIAVVLVVLWPNSAAMPGNDVATGVGDAGSVTPISADTSGSYGDLVKRANELYDHGQERFQSQDYEQGSAYFQAAAKVYAAAWKLKKTEAAVGTDYATSLFYSGNIERAIAQVNAVIAKFPDFQSAYFNKGNYLAHQGRIAEQNGDSEAAAAATAGAKAAYAKAVSIDPQSDVGKAADEQLRALKG